MPVRKIPKNYLSVTGSFSSAKNGKSLGHEFLLERDLMILLEFDDTVERFEEQPVKIPFKKGIKPYVPDILIHYLPNSFGETRQPVLGEVKHTDDLKKHKVKYAPKFEAASRFASERGWEWRIFTEKDIRTPYLDNLKFLREYHSAEPEASLQQEVIVYLQDVRGSVTLESLLQKLCPTEDRVLHMAPAIWHLVATKRITVNLKKPLTMKSKLSLPGKG
ncbi:endonuclease, TnsA family [Sulfuricella denitrificans skB26]|uniref:Endonuclease, TnsA family n=1 Tax=Sulfuricella denitrificans (strain DSM 22764 / NBRC 105220 / skB26) TaxID=1163617 RepID=S6AAR4_SULDS|nr:heteromeric transposase endonuclease subunit TnsA [Sulfuricella denitrificans]BAN33988.1 endonuclease, TnsA family [Sulfuricella denitrificans skB26]